MLRPMAAGPSVRVMPPPERSSLSTMDLARHRRLGARPTTLCVLRAQLFWALVRQGWRCFLPSFRPEALTTAHALSSRWG